MSTGSDPPKRFRLALAKGKSATFSPKEEATRFRKTLASEFSRKTANCSLQSCVCIFTLPGFQILASRLLFSAAMLSFIKSKCITLIAQKQEHFFDSSDPTNTSQTDIKRYFVPSNQGHPKRI